MKTPHPHFELIREWALDTSRKVEFRSPPSVSWKEVEDPSWSEECEYRFKPVPIPDYKTYAKVLNGLIQLDYIGRANIEFTFDGETGKLKDAKVLK
jgi:hypothetical protein